MDESGTQGLEELEGRWMGIFQALQRGADVPPAQRLRAEGVMEALVVLGLLQPAELQAAMDECHRRVFGRTLPETWGNDWKTLFPFPQIPGFGVRAPVYPSTRD